MKKRSARFISFIVILLMVCPPVSIGWADTSAPSSPVKLIFIHHSTGGNWLADPNADGPYGGLGTALMNNNYYVSATNYGWGPNSIGDTTDIPNWPDWFTGANSAAVMNAVYSETGQNIDGFGDWPRLSTDPGGENQIIMFKSCFPNSDLYGNPNDPAAGAPGDGYTVSNAKAVYNNLLTYFQTRTDKLFVVVTAPPAIEADYTPDIQSADERSANARAFNNWLVNDWLASYPYKNVAVFDYYNVLTAADNHHRWNNGAVEHVVNTSYNYAAYPVDTYDSHPSTTGQQKATSEFVGLLNYFYNTWQPGQSGTTIQSDLSFTLQNVSLQSGSGSISLSAGFQFFGDQSGTLLWKLASYGAATASGAAAVTIASDLSFTLTDAVFQTASGDINLTVSFTYFGEQNGTHLWALGSYTLN